MLAGNWPSGPAVNYHTATQNVLGSTTLKTVQQQTSSHSDTQLKGPRFKVSDINYIHQHCQSSCHRG